MTDVVDKIRVGDDRVVKRHTEVNGRKWHYWDAVPRCAQRGTVVLIHGYPDLSFGWRYTIPLFLSLGFRCIALDCMGYADTGSSTDLRDFSFRAHADALAAIARAHDIPRFVIGGHDWGGMLVYRVAQWYPHLVSHVFSVCSAFVPVSGRFMSVQDLVSGPWPQFGYQLQFGSEDGKLERAVCSEKRMRTFLNGIYGGKTPAGKRFMTPANGVDLSMVEGEEVGKTPLLSDEEFEFYVKEFMKHGIKGPCNWYRTRKINWEDDQKLPKDVKRGIQQPTLYILATQDDILTREMSMGMEKSIPNLTRGEVPAAHWALWQTPAETNAILKNWFEGVVLGGKNKL